MLVFQTNLGCLDIFLEDSLSLFYLPSPSNILFPCTSCRMDRLGFAGRITNMFGCNNNRCVEGGGSENSSVVFLFFFDKDFAVAVKRNQ